MEPSGLTNRGLNRDGRATGTPRRRIGIPRQGNSSTSNATQILRLAESARGDALDGVIASIRFGRIRPADPAQAVSASTLCTAHNVAQANLVVPRRFISVFRRCIQFMFDHECLDGAGRQETQIATVLNAVP